MGFFPPDFCFWYFVVGVQKCLRFLNIDFDIVLIFLNLRHVLWSVLYVIPHALKRMCLLFRSETLKNYLFHASCPMCDIRSLFHCWFISSCWVDLLIIIWCPSLSIVIAFTLKSILSDTSIASPDMFSFSFAWNIFFHPSTFSHCVSFILKWVSCMQHRYGSWVFYSFSHPMSFDWNI